MVELIIKGVRCVVSEKVAEQYEQDIAEIERENEERAREQEERDFVWHVAEQYVETGSSGTYDFFSDIYKDCYGVRPRYSREELAWILKSRKQGKFVSNYLWSV